MGLAGQAAFHAGPAPGAQPQGEWHRLLWAHFLHANEAHLFYNMSSLMWKVRGVVGRVGAVPPPGIARRPSGAGGGKGRRGWARRGVAGQGAEHVRLPPN